MGHTYCGITCNLLTPATMQAACQRGSGCGWHVRPRAAQRRRKVAAAAVRIRHCRPADTEQVFAERTFAELDVPALNALDQRYAAAVQREVAVKLQEALSSKQEAAVASRAARLQQQTALLRAQLAAVRGEPATWPTQGPQQRRQEASWRRTRTWVCLLATATPPHLSSSSSSNSSNSSGSSSSNGSSAGNGTPQVSALLLPGSNSPQQQQQQQGQQGQEEGAGEVLLGCLTLNLMQPEAALPPPWPSAAPWRPYLANMAVAPGSRRQGVAAALLAAAERVVRAWGEEGIWLHVAEDNTPAQALYTTRGYTRVQGASDRPFSLTPIIPKRQLLLTKPLAPRSSNQSSSGSSAGAVVAAGGVGDVQEGGQTGAEMAANEAAGASSSSSSSSSGVYTWQVATQPKAEK